MQNPDPLVRTKLHLPFIRLNLVARPDLQAQFTEGLRSSLTLVIAPAGFGKTTLVASCLAGYTMPVAWLSLDEDDNQVKRFLTYLTESLRSIDEKISRGAAQLLSDFQPAPFEPVLTSLINGLDNLKSDIVLVLDDYHLIHNQDVNKLVAFLLEHCPNRFHLVIASRSDPPLPVARLRARGQLVELRSGDLRFTEREAAQFLNDLMGLNLDEKFVAALEERTEGWIAGLQLAALSMRDRQDVAGFIKNFSGTNRYILDYLVEETLTRQPPEIQHFLICTSILERMTASLCDAILGQINGLAPEYVSQPNPQIFSQSHRSAAILEYLERSNLFLVPLDDERHWFRYHHLFVDLLRARLSNSPFAEMITPMHTHASAWFEANGFLEEAIHHSISAGNYPEAARQIETAAENAWLNGQYANILEWTRALPGQFVSGRPWLCVWNAWAYTQMGIHQEIHRWIEAAVKSADNENVNQQALVNEIAALEVFAVSFQRNYAKAISLAEDVLNGPPLQHKKSSEFIRCNILHLLSSMYYATGQIQKTEQTCLETIELARRIGFTLRYVHSINKLILTYQVTGHLARADQAIEEARAYLESQGYKDYFAGLQLHFREIELLTERGRLAEAQHLIEWARDQVRGIDVPYLLVDFHHQDAMAFYLKQDFNAAQNALDQAADLARRTYIWEGLTWQTERLQVRLWLQKDDFLPAESWADTRPMSGSASISFTNETTWMSQARILLAKGASKEAILLLNLLADTAEKEGRKGSLLEIRILRAIALRTNGDTTRATAEIESALALAEPEGYIRTLVDEGQPLQELLVLYLARARSGRLRDYTTHVLAQMDGSLKTITPEREESSANSQLVDPLSPRELEVLHLMSLGKTNQEIANTLIVARGTIKAQAVSIFRKLDAANRTEAVARARQLGILP
jgi:LuxR family transcriptional regulator, maltose regulon positive regulatory protein